MVDDTNQELARALHEQGRVPLGTLQGVLAQARATGRSLEALLVHRGLLTPAELASFTRGRSSAAPAPESAGSREMASALVDVFRSAPERVGPFRLLEQLGAGGMGTVYRAEHAETGRSFALKLLPGHSMGNKRARFQREGEAQAQADAHPNVVKVHTAGEDAGYLYLAMDLCSGGDLSDRLERDGALPPLEAAELCAALADGLAHVHSKGVLHRDLKPANVLIDEAGVPKLVDFGLARTVDAETLTKTGAMMGTPAYMAPEQVRGKTKQLDARTDIYGLGMILYEALTGELPFKGPGLALIRAVITDSPPRPRSIRSEIPPWLEQVCLKALAKEPEARFQTAAEFALALRTPTRSAVLPAALALLVFAVVASFGGVALSRGASADPSPTPAPSAPALEVSPPTAPPRSLPPEEVVQFELPLYRFSEAVLGFCLLGDGRVVTSHEDQTARLWIGEPPRLVRSWSLGLERPTDVTALPDGGSVVVTSTRERAAYLIDLTSEAVSEPIKLPVKPQRTAVSKQELLAVGDDDPTAYVMDLRTGQVTHQLGPHASRVTALDFSPDGSTLLVGRGQNLEDRSASETVVRLWDLSGSEERVRLPTTGKPTRAVFLKDGARVAVATSGGMITIHDTADGSIVQSLVAKAAGGVAGSELGARRAHNIGVRDLIPLPDGRLISLAAVTFESSYEMRVWSGGTEQHSVALELAPDHGDASADGTRLLLRSRGGQLHMWAIPPADYVGSAPVSDR